MKTEPELTGHPHEGVTVSPESPLKDPPSPALPTVDLPESLRYRIKNRLLGPPLHTEELENERLGIPTALAVFSSDCISSSAYATEEILRVLIPAAGLFAFSLVLPITTAMLVVLFFLILSYRETIKEYPTAGGAYMVTRDNFGLLPAQVAGTSLLTDYVLTVSVSTAAGTAALTSAFSVLQPFTLPISIFFVVLLAFVNLKGVKESGKIFAAPTYAFIVIMGVLLLVGVVKALGGNLHAEHLEHAKGAVTFKDNALGQGLFYGVGLYVVLHAFASGGAAVTGVEAISNGVTAFRKPEWKNARVTLIIMGVTLGTLFFGLSALATKVHPIPFESGSPTVISQIGKFVFGGGLIGNGLYYFLQAGTMLILVLAANTSFADFPRLASFHAGDNFMPKQLTTRGHRLVFSNGIISLAVAAIVLLIATGAKVDRLIPLYAIGVFTSFTMSQAGMAKHHVTRKEPGWRKGLFVNGTGAVLSLIVDAIILVTKFTHGAWVIVVIVPLMVAGLVRLNRQYEAETEELETDAPAAAAAPILRRHNVLVLVDSLDVASARAIQYARTLTPDELRALHFALDPAKTEHLREEWARLGLTRLPLDIIECPDRRISRAVAEAVAADLAGGDTEVSVLIPRRRYRRAWHQLLHDRTADSIADALAGIAHCNVTIVPYVLGSRTGARIEEAHAVAAASVAAGNGPRGAIDPRSELDEVVHAEVPAGCTPIADVRYRQHAKVGGRIHTQRVRPWSGIGTLECTLVDGTGAITVVFLGRRHVPGIGLGTHMIVEGAVGQHGGRLAILNPIYELFSELR